MKSSQRISFIGTGKQGGECLAMLEVHSEIVPQFDTMIKTTRALLEEWENGYLFFFCVSYHKVP